MKDSVNIDTILDSAVEREKESHAFYSNVACQSNDKNVKETFKQLAVDELGHMDFLKKCKKDKNLLRNLPVPQDYKVAEATEGPVLSTNMKPQEAIALAMKKEQEAAEFYSKLAACAIDSTYRETFKGLANMELGHKTHLETIFVDIGYPEAW